MNNELRFSDLKVGDVVWMRNHHLQNKRTPNFIVPLTISKKVGPSTYHLFDTYGKLRSSPVNIQYLKVAVFEHEPSENWYEQFVGPVPTMFDR